MQETALNCNENPVIYPENMQNLPVFARNLIEILGFETARRVIEQLGGASWRFNATPTDSRERADMVARIGESTYQQLQQQFAGEALYIPKCQKALLAARNQTIRTTLKQCAENVAPKTPVIRELVKQFRLSDRRIAQIAGEAKPDNPQDGLF